MAHVLDIESRRRRIEKAWNLKDTVVLIGAGSPINKPGHADQCFEFAPHPDFLWLTGVERGGSVLAFDPLEGWTLFAPPVTQLERVWEQVVEAQGAVDIGLLPEWMAKRAGRSVAALGCPVDGVSSDADLSYELGVSFLDERRHKDSWEIEQMRRAVFSTACGHAAGLGAILSGVTEKEVMSVIEFAFMEGGADGPGYHTIVGVGANSAVFHFTPGSLEAEQGDFVLIDAGASVGHYIADVTRTHVVGEMAGWQKDVFAAVSGALDAGLALCRPGVRWVDVHLAAARTIAEGLRGMGVLLCGADEAIETGAIALFFPHGVGHAVGLGVRDAGGPWPRREKATEAAGVKIRVDFVLEAGHTMTAEPGLYFIPALLEDAANRDKHADRVAWDVVAQYVGKGGVRLEDNVLITPGGCENLTKMIPK